MIKSLILGLLFFAATPSKASEGARLNVYVNPTYTHEGDGSGRDLFNVACSSHLWVSVVNSSTTSRSVVVGAISTNGGADVCISTTSTATHPCDDTTAGLHLTPGSSYSDYTTGAWNCRSRANQVDRVYGVRSKHSED